MNIIPFKDIPAFKERVTLDNVTIQFVFHWNTRAESWQLDILDTDENLLVGGIRLVIGWDLFTGYAGRGLPPGQLWIIDTTEDTSNIEFEDFTGDRQLSFLYLTEEEAGI